MTDRASPDPRDPAEGAPGVPYDVRDDYDDEFGRAVSPRELARRRLLPPAVAFLVIGVLGILGMIATAVGVVAEFVTIAQEDVEFVIMAVYLLLTLVGGLLFALSFAGGLAMLGLQRYRLALAAAFFVTGLSLAGCYGILFYPFGIWALILLYRSEVRAQFQTAARPGPPVTDAWEEP
ncbi:MAG: hypothetical protein J2P46_00360 [Zavarzinella sp.]|nr:hypothetical protein [Zavarzinella sp.]